MSSFFISTRAWTRLIEREGYWVLPVSVQCSFGQDNSFKTFGTLHFFCTAALWMFSQGFSDLFYFSKTFFSYLFWSILQSYYFSRDETTTSLSTCWNLCRRYGRSSLQIWRPEARKNKRKNICQHALFNADDFLYLQLKKLKISWSKKQGRVYLCMCGLSGPWSRPNVPGDDCRVKARFFVDGFHCCRCVWSNVYIFSISRNSAIAVLAVEVTVGCDLNHKWRALFGLEATEDCYFFSCFKVCVQLRIWGLVCSLLPVKMMPYVQICREYSRILT